MLLHCSFARGGLSDVMPGKCCLIHTAADQACPESLALRRTEKRTLAEEE